LPEVGKDSSQSPFSIWDLLKRKIIVFQAKVFEDIMSLTPVVSTMRSWPPEFPGQHNTPKGAAEIVIGTQVCRVNLGSGPVVLSTPRGKQ
jgi:hypothetical protein